MLSIIPRYFSSLAFNFLSASLLSVTSTEVPIKRTNLPWLFLSATTKHFNDLIDWSSILIILNSCSINSSLKVMKWSTSPVILSLSSGCIDCFQKSRILSPIWFLSVPYCSIKTSFQITFPAFGSNSHIPICDFEVINSKRELTRRISFWYFISEVISFWIEIKLIWLPCSSKIGVITNWL